MIFILNLKEVLKKIKIIYNNRNLYEKYCLLTKEKHIFYFKIIVDNIPEIQTLNLMIAGFAGSRKSCLLIFY